MGRIFAAVGRVLVVAGILMLLFVTYQLWGTGLYANREQSKLRSQFETALSQPPLHVQHDRDHRNRAEHPEHHDDDRSRPSPATGG